jgi:1-acyl-sn-glycerol-3-phosphate acyltransferase
MNDHTPRISLDYRKSRLSGWARARQAMILFFSTALFVAGSLFLLVVAMVTLFQARRLYAEGIARNLARMILWMHGVRLVVHRPYPWPAGQVVYISNHTSALDPLVILALGLPNARYFMGGFLRAIMPIWLVGSIIGMFWTPSQAFPEKRRNLFRKASELLHRRGESVFLTPEGQICWVFNKGAFHLAISLQAPIVPFFITIPGETDPGPWRGGSRFEVRAGEVHVHFKPAIDTRSWSTDDLDAIRKGVRAMYFAWARELNDKSAFAPEAAGLDCPDSGSPARPE